MSNLARQSTVSDIVGEYARKSAAIDDEVAAFQEATTRLQMAACVQGKYVAPAIHGNPHVDARDLRLNLCKSGWQAVYDRLQIDRIASANDRRLFAQTIESPPELTMENARATFGDYLERPRYHILRGLAEVFASLDPAYKSHSKVKIGVKGLPKRVILASFGDYSCTYGQDRFRDIANALAAYQGLPMIEYAEFSAMSIAHRRGEDAVLDGRLYTDVERYGKRDEYQTLDRGMTVRRFANGNAHVFFTPATLLDINRALAEFYGEVLPDVDPEAPEKAPSTAVAKDLQFYWTPDVVAEKAAEAAGIWNLREWRHNPPAPLRVLEPSCGDGRIMDAIRRRGHQCFGIEYHAGRAAEARAKGHSVLHANFLEHPARPEFDRVVMNPPFYGRHYAKHVRHALKFLKPGGVLVSILPATAHYDHDELKGDWSDLPVGSFSEAGTNVPTGLLKIKVAA